VRPDFDQGPKPFSKQNVEFNFEVQNGTLGNNRIVARSVDESCVYIALLFGIARGFLTPRSRSRATHTRDPTRTRDTAIQGGEQTSSGHPTSAAGSTWHSGRSHCCHERGPMTLPVDRCNTLIMRRSLQAGSLPACIRSSSSFSVTFRVDPLNR